MKKIIIFGMIFLFLIIFIMGCAQEKAESKTTEETEKQIQTPPQQPITKTQIKVSGQGVKMVISPSQGKMVKDMVTITVTKVPPNTLGVALAIQGPGIESMEKTGPNLGLDSDGSDGWSFEFDTYSYPNDEYTLAAIAFPSVIPGEGTPPLGVAQAPIVIENSEFSPVPSPAVNAPYKIMGGSCQNPLQSIEDAKQMHANVIGINIIVGSTNEKDGSSIWEPPEKVARRCAKLIALAHENSFGTGFSVGLANKGNFIVTDFNREKFIQSRKEMLRAYASFAQQNKVSMFTVAGEIDSVAAIGTVHTVDRTKLTYDLSKELISEVREVYDGKIIIGLAGVEADEVGVSHYYPFEGANIICFSANALKDDAIEANLQLIRNLTIIMKEIGQKVGIREVMLCEISLLPKEIEVDPTDTEAWVKMQREEQALFNVPSYLKHRDEFLHRLITEVGPELSGMNLAPPGGVFSLKGESENTFIEDLDNWK